MKDKSYSGEQSRTLTHTRTARVRTKQREISGLSRLWRISTSFHLFSFCLAAFGRLSRLFLAYMTAMQVGMWITWALLCSWIVLTGERWQLTWATRSHNQLAILPALIYVWYIRQPTHIRVPTDSHLYTSLVYHAKIIDYYNTVLLLLDILTRFRQKVFNLFPYYNSEFCFRDRKNFHDNWFFWVGVKSWNDEI